MRIAFGAGVLGVAAVGIGVAVAVFSSSTYRLASVAPENTSLWLEVRDVEKTLAAFRQSPSFQDYGRSASKKQVDKAWEQLLSLNESAGAAEWKAMGLPLSERSLLLALGQNVGLGAIASGDAPPSAFVATKIDMIGLAKDVAVEGDWTKVWERLRGSLGGPEAAVEPYQGYDLVSRKLDAKNEVHFSMLSDVLVASFDKDTVKALIEVKAGTRPSLAERKSFATEVDALAKDCAAYAWIDLELLRDREKIVAAVKKVAERLGEADAVATFDGEELAVLQADLAPVNGLAVGLYLPKGDVYAAHLEASRAEEQLFRDCTRHDLRDLLGEDTFVYVEARGLYDLGRRMIDSQALAALVNSQAVRWARTQLEKPGELPMDVRRASPVPLEADPTFEARVALTLAALPLREVLGNDIALAVESHDAKTPEEALRPLAFVRSRPLVRMVVDVASGVLAAQTKRGQGGPAEVTDHGDRKIYGLTKPSGVYWTQVGAELAISTRKDMLQRVIDRAKPNGAPPSEFQASVKRLPEGYSAFFYFDLRKNRQLAKNLTAGSGDAAQVEKLDTFMNGLDAQATAFYVDEACTTYTVRTWQHLGEQLDPSLRKVYDHALASKDSEPGAWTHLPEETWLSLAGQTDPQALWDYALRLAKATLGEKQVADGLAAVSKELLAGQDAQAALIAPLGSNLGWGVLSQPRLGAAPDADVIAVPASVFALQLKDPAAALTFEKGLEALLGAALAKANASSGGGDDKYAAMQLRTFASAQTLFREGDKEGDGELDYGAIEELAMSDLIGWDLAGGSANGWTFELKVTDPSASWIATARQNDAGPEEPTLVIDQECVVMEVAGRVELTDSSTMPAGAVAFGTLPRAPRTVDPNDPRLTKLAKFDLAGTQATRLELPARDREQFEAMFGKGFTPCFAFAGGWLHVATSEHALAKTLAATPEQGSLAKSADFRRLVAKHPTRVVLFSHLSWSGLTALARENGERLARELAPLPPELKLPARPEFPEVTEGQEDMDKVFAKFQEESEAYEKVVAEHAPKAAAWRKEHAAANAAKMVGPLGELLGLMGGMISYSTVDADGKGLESVVEVRLDPTAVAPTAAQ
jgi:hypothetical protein